MAVLLLLVGVGVQTNAASGAEAPTLAVVETDAQLAPLADLLTAQLSQEGVQLVERKQLDAVLQEQELSAAGLTDRANMVKVGKLVRADAFVLLSLEATGRMPVVRLRVAETAHGIRLLDTFSAWAPAKAQEAAGAMAAGLKGVVDKLEMPPGQVVAVGIMDVRRSLLGDEEQWLCLSLKAALSARLSVEPRIAVLERDDLDLLMQEKALTSGEQGGFWRSAVLITGVLEPQGKGMELALGLQGPGGADLGTVVVPASDEAPAAAAQEAALKLVPKLTDAAASATWSPEQEAAEFSREGKRGEAPACAGRRPLGF